MFDADKVAVACWSHSSSYFVHVFLQRWAILIRSIAREREWLQLSSFFIRKTLKNCTELQFFEVCSQVCVANIWIWMVLIEAAYLKKLFDKVCHGSAWIICASMKENKEWEMWEIYRFHTWAWEGEVWEPRVASLFTWTRIQEPCVQSWRMGFFFRFPPAPHLLQAFFSIGYCYMFQMSE